MSRSTRTTIRHPEVPASSRASKGDGPDIAPREASGTGEGGRPSRLAQERGRAPQGDGTKYERASIILITDPILPGHALVAANATLAKFQCAATPLTALE